MPDYQKMYGVLFNAITDALEHMGKNPAKARELLMSAQQQTEELYISAEERNDEQ